MTRRLAVAVFAPLALVAGAAWFAGRSGESGRAVGGPLACLSCAEERSSIPARRNAPVSFGLVALVNRGSKPAVLEGVHALNRTPGMEVVRALVSRPRGIGLVHGYPEPDAANPLRPVAGFVVPPDGTDQAAFQVILVLRIAQDGRAWFRHVAVDYRVGDRKYRAVFPESVALCTAALDRRRRCALPPW